MMSDILSTPISMAEQALIAAKTPKESKDVEALAAAAKAWAKEQGYYEGVVDASRIHILARRNTTELIMPIIEHGGDHKSNDWNQGNNSVTLIDYGFTKM